MAEQMSKAQKRQSGKASNKTRFASNFATGIKNKIRKLTARVKHHPGDGVAAERLEWWKKNGYTRKGTKRAK